MKAIILAGGMGTRLRSMISDVPKPMAPILDKPFLAYLLQYLQGQGVTKVVLSVYHMREKIEQYFQSSYQGIQIEYAVEEKPLGTGGAIQYALQKMPLDEPVFVLNGDTFLELNYRSMYNAHLAEQAVLSIAVKEMQDCSRYGKAIIENDLLTGFTEKGEQGGGLINGGVYLLRPSLFSHYALPAVFSFENDFLVPHINILKPRAFLADHYFIDIGVPEDYLRATVDLPHLLQTITQDSLPA